MKSHSNKSSSIPTTATNKNSPLSTSQSTIMYLQRTIGNKAVSNLITEKIIGEKIQRNQSASQDYTPQNPASALSSPFFLHHTPRVGDEITDELAIRNHETRAKHGLNTSFNMTRDEAQAEIRNYLLRLNAQDSANLINESEIEFTTKYVYRFIETDWNNGSPVVTSDGSANLRLRMSWHNGGYYQIYHFEALV